LSYQIPNPLFDLAGITCGHFLVPFWTFFGATLIGKAIVKTHLQQLTVIVAFNESLVNKLLTSLANVSTNFKFFDNTNFLKDEFRVFCLGSFNRIALTGALGAIVQEPKSQITC
jgi:hypothetical protein